MLFAAAILLMEGNAPMHAKEASVIVTAQMRACAVRNCERYAWASAQRERLLARVKPYLALSDEALWALLPSQEMPRDSGVDDRSGAGCPSCGKKHYEAPYNPRWVMDILGRPWKVQCRQCGQWFPRNDFAAYYRSALDATGRFRLGKGNPRFLQPEGPGPAWVDDGTGVKVGANTWFFAAGYAFRVWQEMIDLAENLALLYTLTNDPSYAHRAGVLLDRMADLYPEMDYEPHYRLGMEASTGGSGKGRVQGCIWECFTAQKLSHAYDWIYDALIRDEALARFSQQMAQRYATGDKSSPAAIARHIEEHLLLEFVKGVFDGRIRGNLGMHQYALAAAAIALDRPDQTPALLQWLFQPNGGQIPTVLVEVLSREGFSHESGLGYAAIPATSLFEVAELLRRYPRYRGHDLYRDFPKFRNCFVMGSKVRVIDRYSPNWGDGDKCMNLGNTGFTLPLEMALAGYRVYGGREMAREVWFSNGKRWEGLRGDIYDPEPEALLERLQHDCGPTDAPLQSYNSGGYGMAVLQAPYRQNARGIALYYGRMAGHGHEDRLAISLVAEDVVMTPDLGYPLYTGAWPKRIGWTRHVVSHNTCMVNDTSPDNRSYSGKTKLFAEAGPVRVADVDGGNIYEGVDTYRRCLVMVDVDARHSYILDLFWVRGGKNHRLIQNGGGPEATHSGLPFVPQERGTYAGEDVPFGHFYDGPPNWSYRGTGFMYLKRVEKAKPAGDFWVDWRMVEPRRNMPEDWEAHLRVHNLSAVDEVALCDGIPPEYKGNPPSLRYLLRTRYGEGRHTQFLSILEPYAKTPFIRSARALVNREEEHGFVAAVEMELANGQRDLLLVTEQGGEVAARGVSLKGRVGFVRFEGEHLLAQALIAGERLAVGSTVLSLPQAAIAGKLVKSDESDVAHTLLRVDTSLPRRGLEGRYILFQNQERSDASYRIERVVDEYTLDIGCNSLAERFVDPKDYTKGVVCTIAPGDPFEIPLSAFRMATAKPSQ